MRDAAAAGEEGCGRAQVAADSAAIAPMFRTRSLDRAWVTASATGLLDGPTDRDTGPATGGALQPWSVPRLIRVTTMGMPTTARRPTPRLSHIAHSAFGLTTLRAGPISRKTGNASPARNRQIARTSESPRLPGPPRR